MLVTCIKCNRHVETGDAVPGAVVHCACGLGIMVPEGPAAAGKMNCPSCGAPVDPDRRRCGYCDTRLATVMCPGCFGAVFEGTRHCPHCGEGLEGRMVILHGDRTDHPCPRCEAHPVLRVEVVAGIPLARCPECEGLWVDRETVEKIYKNREKAGTLGQMTQPKGTSPERQAVECRPEGYIKCPQCQKIMNRQNFGRCSGVIVDLCRDHGTWFDANELRKILEFIASGGLEKAAEREKMELQEELRRLRQGQVLAGGSGGLHSGFGRRLESEGLALGITGGLLRGLFGW